MSTANGWLASGPARRICSAKPDSVVTPLAARSFGIASA
jgi:hypothetical protein